MTLDHNDEYVPGAALQLSQPLPEASPPETESSQTPTSGWASKIFKASGLALIAAGMWVGSTSAYRTLTTDFNPKLSRSVTTTFGQRLRHAGVRHIDPNGKWVERFVLLYGAGNGYYMVSTKVMRPSRGSYRAAFDREDNEVELPLSIRIDADGTASVYYEPTPDDSFEQVNARVEKLVGAALAVAESENFRRDQDDARHAENIRSWNE